MILSKGCEYGIRALITIMTQTQENKRIGVKEIADKAELPAHFTANLLKTYVKQGLLSSLKGPNGGFFFNSDQKELKLMDVILATDGNAVFANCGLGLTYCSDKNPCPVHEEFVKIRDEFRSMCEKTSIESLADKLKDGKAILVK